MEVEDARRVVAVLSAAFPAFPMNDDSTKLYVEALADKVRDAAIAFVVVTDWVTGRTTFPTLADLLEECSQETGRRLRRAEAIARGASAPGSVCQNCQGSGWERHAIVDGAKLHPSYADVEAVMPCRVCDSTRYEDWRDGHNLIDHDVDDCEWPLCAKRAKSKSRPRRRQTVPASSAPANDGRYEPRDAGPGF